MPLILSRDAHGSKIYTPAMLIIAGFLLGVASGMRSMTPMAVVAWAAQWRWPQLRQTSLSFLTAPLTAYIFTACAAIELVFDKLPFTPAASAPGLSELASSLEASRRRHCAPPVINQSPSVPSLERSAELPAPSPATTFATTSPRPSRHRLY